MGKEESYEEKYARIKAQLDELDWPSIYQFKFIVPNNNDKINEVKSLFAKKADISSRVSKKGTYISLSIKELLGSSEMVLEKYKLAKNIDGLIAL